MKSKILIILVFIVTILIGCSKSIEYSEAFKKETAGNYLYNPDDIIEVYYDNNKLYLNWRGGKLEPVALDTNEFFVADMYKKFHFVQHPETKKRYLSVISEDNESVITYDYLKVLDDYKTPSTYLKEGNYVKALEGFLEIKEQDSTSIFISERDFNTMGYRKLRDKDYEEAIEVFKLNIALHPTSDNVYDSLADAYLSKGDSINAFENYEKAYALNPRNRRAKEFIESYE